MEAVSIHEAKAHLSRLIARAEAGEETIVRRGPTPVAEIVAYHPPVAPAARALFVGRSAVTDLPDLHRDPFDRALVAQVRAERIPPLTADPRFGAYGVEARW